MPAARIPDNEQGRLAALKRYDVLDTPPESGFDDLTRLAALVCETPVSIIALIDEARQWFKSRHGVEITETPRELAFCTHTLEAGVYTEVPDLTQDDRFSDNPLVAGEPWARFYAGAPLVSDDGFFLGTLCVVDFRPRNLKPEQKEGLIALSRKVMAQMELTPLLKRERQLREEVSRRSAYQRALLQSTACAILSTDAQGNVTSFNSGAEQLSGYSAKEVLGKPVSNLWCDSEELSARAAELTTELGRRVDAGFEVFVAKAKDGGGETREWNFHRRDGSRGSILLSVSAKRNERGGLNGFMGVAHDLTTRKEAEAQRERMFNLSPDLMCVVGLNGIFQRVNPAFSSLLGFNPEEICSKSFFDFVHQEDLRVTREKIETIRRGESVLDFHSRFRCKTGLWKWISWKAQPYLMDKVFYATGRDETDLRLAAAELSASEERLRELNENLEILINERTGKLKESEERYRSVMESANDGIISTDSSGAIISWNKAAERLFGYQASEILGQRLETLMPEKFRQAHAAGFKRHQETGETKVIGRTVELRGLHRNGSEFPLELSLSTWKTAEGKFFTGIIRDITDRHVAESNLKRQREMLGSLLENLAEGVIACDAMGRMIFINRTALDWHGGGNLDADPLRWPELFGLCHGDGITPLKGEEVPLLRALKGEKVRDVEIVIRIEGREPRIILANGDPLTEGDGQKNGAVVVMRDMTERKQVENQRLRAQRLESLGTLAGGIAHDLNNALSPVLLGVELLRLQYPKSAEVIESMEASMKHGAGMVRQLLTFAKGVEGQRISLRPEQLIQELTTIVKSTFPKNILLRTNCGKHMSTVSGDPTQLQQVLINLCVNARDAMAEGGTLTLDAGMQEIPETIAAQIPQASAGTYVLFRVSDTGEGMSPEVMERIFEPFYSTKGPDCGTGLGLFTVAGIVRGHGGFMRVESEEGKGSTFNIYLPAEVSEVVKPAPAPEGEKNFRGHGETILVVDDEASVRQVAAAVLKTMNFEVLTADEGTQALIEVAEKRNQIKGVITDVHMPGMDGLNFVKVLRRMLPDAGIMVISGRLDERESADFKTFGAKVILHKPFAQADLEVGLRALLE